MINLLLPRSVSLPTFRNRRISPRSFIRGRFLKKRKKKACFRYLRSHKSSAVAFVPDLHPLRTSFSPESFIHENASLFEKAVDPSLFIQLTPDQTLLLIQYCDEERNKLIRLKEESSERYQVLSEVKSVAAEKLPICRSWEEHAKFKALLDDYQSKQTESSSNEKILRRDSSKTLLGKIENMTFAGYEYTVNRADKDSEDLITRFKYHLKVYNETERHLSKLLKEDFTEESDPTSALESIKLGASAGLDLIEEDLMVLLTGAHHYRSPDNPVERVYVSTKEQADDKYDMFMRQYNHLLCLAELIQMDVRKDRHVKLELLNAIERMKTHLLEALFTHLKYELDLFDEKHKSLADYITHKRVGISIALSLLINGLMKLVSDLSAFIEFIASASVAHSVLIVLGPVVLALCLGSLVFKEIAPWCEGSIQHLNTICEETDKQDFIMREGAKKIGGYLKKEKETFVPSGIDQNKKKKHLRIAKVVSILSTIRERDTDEKLRYYKKQQKQYLTARRLRAVFAAISRYIISFACGFVATLGTGLIEFSFAGGVAKIGFLTLTSAGLLTPVGAGLLTAFVLMLLMASAIANRFLKPYINELPWFSRKGDERMQKVIRREKKYPFDHALPYTHHHSATFFGGSDKSTEKKLIRKGSSQKRKTKTRGHVRKLVKGFCMDSNSVA